MILLLRNLIPLLLLLPALAWGQSIDQKRVGFYFANKAGPDCSQSTLEAADSAALAEGRILVIPTNDRFGATCQWTITSNVTIDSPVFIPYATTPVVKVNAGITLTLATCPVVWSDYFIIDANENTTGTVAYSVSCSQCGFSGPNDWTRCLTGGGGGSPGSVSDIADLNNVNADANAADHEILQGVGDGEYHGVVIPSTCNLASEKLFYNADHTWTCETDISGGTPTLDLAFDGGKTIDGATSAANAAQIGNATVKWRFYCDSSDECFQDTSTASPIRLRIQTDQTLSIYDAEGDAAMETWDPDGAAPHDIHTYETGYRPIQSLEWLASAMFGDGTDCDTGPTDETVNGIPTQGLRCPMASSETDGFIYGLPITLPGNFDKTSDALFAIKAYLITDSGAGTWHGQIAIDCVPEGGVPGTYGTAVGLDLTPVSGDAAGDEIHDTAAAVVDTDTTGADCNPGDTLYWRYTSCDTDATPSTGCTSSAGFENDMSIFSIRMKYSLDSRSE